MALSVADGRSLAHRRDIIDRGEYTSPESRNFKENERHRDDLAMARSSSKTFQFFVAGANYRVTLFWDEQGYRLQLDDRQIEFQAQEISDHVLLLDMSGRSVIVFLAGDRDKRFLSVGAGQFVVEEIRESSQGAIAARTQALVAGNALASPMPGQVVKIQVAEGDVVEANQTVAIVEAMKMENELRAPVRARIKKILVSAGDLVDAGQIVVELEIVE